MNTKTKMTVGELFEEAVECERSFEAHGIFWAVMKDLLKPTDKVEAMWKVPYDKKALLLLEKYNVLAHGALELYEEKTGIKIHPSAVPQDTHWMCTECMERILENTAKLYTASAE